MLEHSYLRIIDMASQSIEGIFQGHRKVVDGMREEMDALRKQMQGETGALREKLQEETDALREQLHEQRTKLMEQDRVTEDQKKEIEALKNVWLLENRCCIQHLRTSQATAHSMC